MEKDLNIIFFMNNINLESLKISNLECVTYYDINSYWFTLIITSRILACRRSFHIQNKKG